MSLHLLCFTGRESTCLSFHVLCFTDREPTCFCYVLLAASQFVFAVLLAASQLVFCSYSLVIRDQLRIVNKRQRKPNVKSRIVNPQSLATLDTQDTGRRQTRQRNNTENYNDEQHGPYQKKRGCTHVLPNAKQLQQYMVHSTRDRTGLVISTQTLHH